MEKTNLNDGLMAQMIEEEAWKKLSGDYPWNEARLPPSKTHPSGARLSMRRKKYCVKKSFLAKNCHFPAQLPNFGSFCFYLCSRKQKSRHYGKELF